MVGCLLWMILRCSKIKPTLFSSIHATHLNLIDLLFLFLISNKIYWYKKRDALVHQEVYRGQTNQVQKLHKSRNSRKEVNDWFCKVDSQSTKVLKKNSLRFDMDLSLSLKHLLFLPLQRHHIKQWRTIINIWPFWWRPNRPCQQARSPTIDFGITQL